MKTNTFIFFFLLTTVSFGQSFKKDWDAFVPYKHWELKFNEDSLSFLGVKAQGHMRIRSTADTTLGVVFSVYLKSDTDSIFQKKLKHWLFAQSCTSFTANKINFTTFDFKDYFYLLQPCHRCTNDICYKSAEKLLMYILQDEKQKKN